MLQRQTKCVCVRRAHCGINRSRTHGRRDRRIAHFLELVLYTEFVLLLLICCNTGAFYVSSCQASASGVLAAHADLPYSVCNSTSIAKEMVIVKCACYIFSCPLFFCNSINAGVFDIIYSYCSQVSGEEEHFSVMCVLVLWCAIRFSGDMVVRIRPYVGVRTVEAVGFAREGLLSIALL